MYYQYWGIDMDIEELEYKTLRKIQQAEKQSPIITKINDNFYDEVINYINKLQKRAESEDNPRKKMLLSEELNSNEKIMMNIYEQREKKIMIAAISKARGGNPNIKNILETEQPLFDSLYNIFIKSRKSVLNKESEKTLILENDKVNSDNKIKNDQNKKDPCLDKNTNEVLQITEDIPEFLGTDAKKYYLKKGDIVTVPDKMGNMLIKGKVAKKLNLDEK
jgi:DNA replication initiation complex subunit (GINS family)